MSDHLRAPSQNRHGALAEGGSLDGLTILRFARAYELGGGVEGHLADLNRALGARNRITTIQLQLASDAGRLQPTEHTEGGSRLLIVPLMAAAFQPNAPGATAAPSRLSVVTRMALGVLLPTAGLNAVAMKWLAKSRRIPLRGGEAEGAGARAAEVLRQFNVDLVVLHACGGRDSSEVIDAARAAGVPVAIVHHFANDRLGSVSARQQVSQVAGVGGASSVGVPRYVRDVFWNLSDAVDVDFYSRGNARPIDTAPAEPFIFAPGRYTPEKGQVDVIDVVARLKLRGLRPKVVFAGRADEPAFEAHLRRLVEQRGLGDAVTFLGGLSLAQYRDWYRGAAVMLMPTLHGEGMPRTLIESQAMQVPPVVYDIGGTSEGVRHGETGFLLKRGDVEGMAAAADILLRDRRRQELMGLAGRRFVESAFSLPALAGRHEQFYEYVLGRRPR